MHYKIIDHKWQKLLIDEYTMRQHGFDLQHLLEIEHNENIDLFEKQIQESIVEGWVPLGAPIFTDGWCKSDTGISKRMYQAMILEEKDEPRKLKMKTEKEIEKEDTQNVPVTLLPKLCPRPPTIKRQNSSQINLKSPRTTRAERLRQEFMRTNASTKNGL